MIQTGDKFSKETDSGMTVVSALVHLSIYLIEMRINMNKPAETTKNKVDSF